MNAPLKTNMTLEYISNGKYIFKWWNFHVRFQGVSAMNQSLWIRQKKNTLDSFWAEFSFVNVNVLRNELGGDTKDDSPRESW